MNRPSVKQRGMMEREKYLKEGNESRQQFWKTITSIFTQCKRILALKKKEKKGSVADNTDLDSELFQEWENLCESMLPMISPYLRKLASQRLQTILDKVDLEQAKQEQPHLTKKDIN